MRLTRWTLVALAFTLGATPAGAQDPRTRHAFERAVSLTGAATLFGERFSALNSEYGYKNSVGVGLWGELPITRRTGLLAIATISPISAQRQEGRNANAALYRDVISVATDVGLAARLKPSVPVFFFAGGGVHLATHYANPESDGGAVEPQGTFAIGYDAGSRGRWNVRTAVVGHLVKPADPGGVTVKSTAFDWAFHVGGRFALSSHTAPARGAP